MTGEPRVRNNRAKSELSGFSPQLPEDKFVLKINRTYFVNNCSNISSKSILVDILSQKIIFGSNHDFGSGATCYKTKRVPYINLETRKQEHNHETYIYNSIVAWKCQANSKSVKLKPISSSKLHNSGSKSQENSLKKYRNEMMWVNSNNSDPELE